MTAAPDTKLESKTKNPLLFLTRREALVFRSTMTREEFHRFVLSQPDLKIERDRYGHHPPSHDF